MQTLLNYIKQNYKIMLKFVIMMVISILITQVIELLFSHENEGLHKKEEKIFKVILPQGVIGCISQDKFDQVQKLYAEKNRDEIKKTLNSKDCFVFAKDEEFTGLENYCDEDSKPTDNHIFSSKKFLITKIILPCYAFNKIEISK